MVILEQSLFIAGFPVISSVLISWKVCVAPHKPPLGFPWIYLLSPSQISRAELDFPRGGVPLWGGLSLNPFWICRRGATEREMFVVEVLYHPIWVFFTALLAAVVYLQRRRRWDPKVCSVRLQGKVAVVTGANTGGWHFSLYHRHLLAAKFISGCNMNLFYQISDFVIMLQPVSHLLSLNSKLTTFSGCLFPPFRYLHMHK